MRKKLLPIEEMVMCRVETLMIDFVHHSAQFMLPDDDCTDMSGAIAFATSIDPKCRFILTSNDNECVDYHKRANGWKASSFKKKRLAPKQ